MVKKGKAEFTSDEADEIRATLREKERTPKSEQKPLRDRLRQMEFYISDYPRPGPGFTCADFEALVKEGEVTIWDAHSRTDPPAARRDTKRALREDRDAAQGLVDSEPIVEQGLPGIPEVLAAIDDINRGMEKLKELGVIRSQKLVGDLGEWVTSVLWGGVVAQSKGQPGWDVQTPTEKIQVKSHAKSRSNSTRWTKMPAPESDYDALVIVVFSSRYRIRELYKIPRERLNQIVQPISNPRVHWDDLGAWQVQKESFPHAGRITGLFE